MCHAQGHNLAQGHNTVPPACRLNPQPLNLKSFSTLPLSYNSPTKSRVDNPFDPDQLASQNTFDLELHH